MANIQVVNPYQNFVGLNSVPVQNGYIYIGLENQDPESYPQAVYWDNALTIPAAQPIRTTGGYISNAGAPGQLFTANKYSIRVKDSTGALVFYQASSAFSGSYLPLAGGAMSGAIDFSKGADIASNTLTDIGAATGNYVTITGTTTITAFGTAQAGTMRWLRFAGALTLTHNATSLILPDGASITTVAGDVALFISDGSGNWRCGGYSRTTTASFASFKNLKITTTGTNATVTLTADAVVIENSATVGRTIRNVSVSINTATTGANALDAGTVAASTWYYIHVIYNPTTNTVAGLASLSATSPTLPSGYTMSARAGAFPTDGTANKYPLSLKQFGRKVQYVVAAGTNVTAVPQMSSGVQGSVTTPTWVAVSVNNFVPPTAGAIRVMTRYAGVGFGSAVAPNNAYGSPSSANPPPLMIQSTDANGAVLSADFVLEGTNIYWASPGVSGLLACVGWEDNI